MTTDADLEKLALNDNEETSKFINYEQQRLNVLSSRLQNTIYKIAELQSDFSEAEQTLLNSRVKPVLNVLLEKANTEPVNYTYTLK